MERYLVAISLGPVQGLIGAARRTRDLWSGSWLLSEVCRAAAGVLHGFQAGCLIFPAPKNPAHDLSPVDRPGDQANISNILRAEIEAQEESVVRDLCAQARQAAVERLIAMGEDAQRHLPGLRSEVWQAQIGDLLECFCAWVSIDTDGYEAASERLGRALAARKATRDFLPSGLDEGFGLPKSSLDGALESVLPKALSTVMQRKLGLSSGEQLDALGVIKRRGGDAEQFTAYSRIAADPWIETLTEAQQQRLRTLYSPLVGLDLATRVGGNHGIYDALPYDAQLLYDFRLEKARSVVPKSSEDRSRLGALGRELQAIARERDRFGDPCGTPVPYAVILQADGDRMGEFLSKARSATESRAVSEALSDFADEVRGIVREHRGHAVYSGGDDVLALLPLARSVDCAHALANRFETAMSGPAKQLNVPSAEAPTLSVGLGIGHIMEPLGSLRARALRAEKLAKGDSLPAPQRRRALGILLGIRAGADLEWRARWDDDEKLIELAEMIAAYRADALPSRVAFDLKAIDQRLAWLRDDTSETARGMRSAETRRVLDRARTEGGSQSIDEALQRRLVSRAREIPLPELADTLIVARWLAARTRADVENR